VLGVLCARFRWADFITPLVAIGLYSLWRRATASRIGAEPS